MSLLSRVKIVPNEGNIVFEFPDFLRDKLINPRLYAPIDIILIAGFKSSYSIILYELLRDYLTSPSVPIMSIEDFKNLVGIKKNEYKCFNDFKKRVLEVATKEVNEKTDIYCYFELGKERGVGNKYSNIRFFVSKKTSKIDYEKNKDMKNESLDKAKELNATENPGNPFFIRDSMIEIRMAKLYMENSEINSYQNNDND